MLIAGAVVLVLGLGLIWFLLTRESRKSAVTREDFDATYDDLVAKGDAEPADRDEAWRDFHNWQLREEEERLASAGAGEGAAPVAQHEHARVGPQMMDRSQSSNLCHGQTPLLGSFRSRTGV